MNVVWSQTALNAYLQIIDYLFEKWTEKEVLTFQKKVDSLIIRVSKDNYICPVSRLLNYHKCFVTKQNSLIYTIENNHLILITFIDNRALHSF